MFSSSREGGGWSPAGNALMPARIDSGEKQAGMEMAQEKVRDTHGREVDFDAATRLMDPLLLHQLQSAGSFPDKQSFFMAYAQAHARKFSQSFAPFTGGRW